MSRGYCSVCQRYSDSGKFCGKCGGQLTFGNAVSELKNEAEYPQPHKNRENFVFGFKNMDRLTVIGIVLLALYNIIGIFVCLYAAEAIIKNKQMFLVKINVSYFWLWLFVAINFILLAGTILLRKNKSVLCTVGQGVLWLVSLVMTYFMTKKDLNYTEVEREWANGVVLTFDMGTEVSRVMGISAFSIGHLFVIILWIAALIFIALGRTRETKNNFKI
ncbi:MAG: hypothetical protein II931_01280 [Clostridia bacterium]|nr:hypothetical protein [Clostridia bacterium]